MNRLIILLVLFLISIPCHAYNYESTLKIPVKLSVLNEINSEDDVYEGQVIKLKAQNNVYYNKQILLKRGDIVPAQVKLIIKPGMNGIPASIIIGNIKIKGISDSQLDDSFEIFGQDRSLIVFPLKWALTPLPPTGSLTNFIMGGHVKVKQNKIYTIYFHPEWSN